MLDASRRKWIFSGLSALGLSTCVAWEEFDRLRSPSPGGQKTTNPAPPAIPAVIPMAKVLSVASEVEAVASRRIEIAIFVASFLYDVGKSVFANLITPQDIHPVSPPAQKLKDPDQIALAAQMAGARVEMAKLVALMAGEEETIKALESKIPVWLQTTNKRGYNVLSISMRNITENGCSDPNSGGQLRLRVIDAITKVEEAAGKSNIFCLDAGATGVMNFDCIGDFITPGKKQIVVENIPENIVVHTQDVLVVALGINNDFGVSRKIPLQIAQNNND